MQIKEIWKPVAGYEGYEVSNLGKVKSLNYKRTGKEKIMKPVKDGDGYLRVGLCGNEKRKMLYIHRLVAIAFLPNPMGLLEINHLDENKANNVVGNLEWCDRWRNMHYGTIQEKISASQINHPAKSKVVEASKFPDFRTIEFRFASTQEAKRNGYNCGVVSTCCRGCYNREGNNKYKGLFWRYAV